MTIFGVTTARWIKVGREGSTFVYHVGYLPVDRFKRKELNANAAAMYRAYEAGVVLLTQKRLGPSVYEYRAVKRRVRRRP